MSIPILLILKTVILKEGPRANPRIPGAKELEVQAQTIKKTGPGKICPFVAAPKKMED
jgi:hypothetical protein